MFGPTSMAFSVYKVTFPATGQVSGFAQFPEIARDLAVIDATREKPWTILGTRIKQEYDEFPKSEWHGLFKKHFEVTHMNLPLQQARDARSPGYPLTYSLVDDAYPEPGLAETCVNRAFPEIEFNAPFFSVRPIGNHRLSAPQMIGSMFRAMNSSWSTPMVYDKRHRKVNGEMTMNTFLDAVIPWFIDNVINCLKCLIRNDDIPHMIPDEECADAYHCLRKLYTVVTRGENKESVTIADAIMSPGNPSRPEYAEMREIIKSSMIFPNAFNQ